MSTGPAAASNAKAEPIPTIDRTAFPGASAFENELLRPTGSTPAFTNDSDYHDLTKSHKGLSFEPFPPEISDILLAPINEADVEVKPGNALSLCSVQ